MTNYRKLTIHFESGASTTFRFPKQVEAAQLAAAIQKTLGEDKLCIEAEGKLLVFPWSSIRYIEASPAPEKLPSTVVRGAQLVG